MNGTRTDGSPNRPGISPPRSLLPAHRLPDTSFFIGPPDAQLLFLKRKVARLSREIRERRIAERELRLQKRSAEEANHRKSASLAAMSHELQTPLHAILGYLKLLEESGSGSLPLEQKEPIDRIRRATEHLSSIIQASLTFSALEAGKVEPKRERTDAVLIASEALELIAPAADEKGLTISLHRSAERIYLWTDSAKVRQMLVNLLSNGVKFTAAGEVCLTVRQARGWVLFDVRDSGIGISTEHQERIFNPFWQSDHGRATRVLGTGLGLAVTKALAQLLGGSVKVESTPGCGSIFSVRLPISGPSPRNKEPS